MSDERFPRITFDFVMAAHLHEWDAKEFGKKIRELKPQVIGLELVGHSKRYDDLYNGLAAGRIDVSHLGLEQGTKFPDYTMQLFRELHNSKAIVVSLDIPASETALVAETTAVDDRHDHFIDDVTRDRVPFEEALSRYAALTQEAAADDLKRERYSLRTLEESIAELIANNEQLKKLRTIKVVVLYGAGHTSLPQAMRAQHADSHMRLAPFPFIYSHDDEAIRLSKAGKEVPLDIIERALMSNIFKKPIRDVLEYVKVPQRDISSSPLERAIIDALTPEERKMLYERYVIEKDRGGAVEFMVNRAVEVLTARGYITPEAADKK